MSSCIIPGTYQREGPILLGLPIFRVKNGLDIFWQQEKFLEIRASAVLETKVVWAIPIIKLSWLNHNHHHEKIYPNIELIEDFIHAELEAAAHCGCTRGYATLRVWVTNDDIEFRSRCEYMSTFIYIVILALFLKSRTDFSLNYQKKKSRAGPAFPSVWLQLCLLTLTVHLTHCDFLNSCRQCRRSFCTKL